MWCPAVYMPWRVTFPRKTWYAPSLIEITACVCPHSQAGSSTQSSAGFPYTEHGAGLSGLLLHTHSLQYLLRGKTNTGFGPELFWDLKAWLVTEGCPREGAAGAVGTAYWGPSFLRQAVRGDAGGNTARAKGLSSFL